MNISANNFSRIALLLAFFITIPCFNAMSDPCCIIVVPPPPPPPKESEPPLAFFGSIYATLPIEFAIRSRSFASNLKVDVQRAVFSEAVGIVIGTLGALGVAQIDTLARFKADTQAEVEIAAVLVNRPYFSIYTIAAGPKTISQLKGQRIAISSGLDQLFAAEALRASPQISAVNEKIL
jgi:hypothetical protein